MVKRRPIILWQQRTNSGMAGDQAALFGQLAYNPEWSRILTGQAHLS